MSNYKVETIRLGTQKPNTDYWVNNVNDTTIVTIAEKLGLKVNTITSDSVWILYKGDDAYNTTGFRIRYANDRIYMETVVRGVVGSNDSLYSRDYAIVSSSNSQQGAFTAKICYIKIKNTTLIGIGNIKEGEEYPFMLITTSGTNVKTNDEHIVYIALGTYAATYKILAYTNTAESPYLTIASNPQSQPNDFIALYPFALAPEYIVIPNIYSMAYGRSYSTTLYTFDINKKTYLVPPCTDNQQRLAFELPD